LPEVFHGKTGIACGKSLATGNRRNKHTHPQPECQEYAVCAKVFLGIYSHTSLRISLDISLYISSGISPEKTGFDLVHQPISLLSR